MTTITSTISREAGDKAKGFRLQKLRAAKLMLDTLEVRRDALFYGAIEVVEDVSLTVAGMSGTSQYYEEDKNFDEETNFTIFSKPVLNTLVSFFDIYINQWQGSSNVVLGFYTTADIGKERKNKLDDGTSLTLPKNPVLNLLQSGSLTPDLAETVKLILIEEYAKQYKEKKTNGNLKTLEETSTASFIRFLESISWNFCEEDEVSLKQTVLQSIRDSSLFNFKVANKEETILSLLLEKFDERQNLPDLANRFVTAADVKLIFKEAESEEVSHVLDPVWADLKKLESEIQDKRNLKEKVEAVCSQVSMGRLRMLARIACRSKTEKLSANKSFLALQYRVFEACEEYLCSMGYQPPGTEAAFNQMIEDLNLKAQQSIAELKNDYTYTVSNTETIKGIIMDLIDSCFIALEKP